MDSNDRRWVTSEGVTVRLMGRVRDDAGTLYDVWTDDDRLVLYDPTRDGVPSDWHELSD